MVKDGSRRMSRALFLPKKEDDTQESVPLEVSADSPLASFDSEETPEKVRHVSV